MDVRSIEKQMVFFHKVIFIHDDVILKKKTNKQTNMATLKIFFLFFFFQHIETHKTHVGLFAR